MGAIPDLGERYNIAPSQEIGVNGRVKPRHYGRVQNQPVMFPVIYLIFPVPCKCHPDYLALFLTDFYLPGSRMLGLSVDSSSP